MVLFTTNIHPHSGWIFIFGQSPIEYYTELKIKEAKKLLREKNHSVSQISDMLGYSSIHIFPRAFKKAVGFSPTAYVKSIL